MTGMSGDDTTAPYVCLDCGADVVEVTAAVDPQTLGWTHHAQCGHRLLPEVAASLAEHHGYTWTVPRVDGAALIAAERARQIRSEGYTPAHDATHTGSELAWAAHAYIQRALTGDSAREDPPTAWPWAPGEWKPDKEPLRLLVIAGALLAAEVDAQLTARRVETGRRQ